jgi:hypothetical protein
MRERPQREKKRGERMRALDLSAVGLAFPIAIVFGYLAGRGIGRWLDHESAGIMIGILVGIAAGFYNFFKLISRFHPERPAGDDDAGPVGPEP